LAYLAVLRRDYRLGAAFGSARPLGGRRNIDGLPIQDLPHDMLYPSPHVLIYARR
jgi:hypothetical protein